MANRGRNLRAVKLEHIAAMQNIDHKDKSAFSILCTHFGQARSYKTKIHKYLMKREEEPNLESLSVKLHPRADNLVVVHSVYAFKRSIDVNDPGLEQQLLWYCIPFGRNEESRANLVRYFVTRKDWDKVWEIVDQEFNPENIEALEEDRKNMLK